MTWPPAPLSAGYVDGDTIFAGADNARDDAIDQLVAHVVAGPDTPVGGDLTGNLPNPELAAAVVLDAHVGAAAGIAEGKLGLATPTSLIAGWMKIAETDLSATAVSFDFQSIPATYKHLWLILELRTDKSATSDQVLLALNNDTTNANYAREILFGSAASPGAAENLTASATSGNRNLGSCCAASSLASSFAHIDMLFPNYASTTKTKHVKVSNRAHLLNTTGGLLVQEEVVGWTGTAAINRITILPVAGPNFVAGCTASLYGLLSAA